MFSSLNEDTSAMIRSTFAKKLIISSHPTTVDGLPNKESAENYEHWLK